MLETFSLKISNFLTSSENELQKIWDLIILSFLSASFEICTGLMFCISLRNVCSQLRIVKRRRWRRQRFDTFLECWLAPTPSYLLLSCNFLFAQNCHFVNESWMLNIQEQIIVIIIVSSTTILSFVTSTIITIYLWIEHQNNHLQRFIQWLVMSSEGGNREDMKVGRWWNQYENDDNDDASIMSMEW